MKKRIFAVIMIAVLMLSCSVSSYAASKELVIDSSYDADTNLVLVSISIDTPDTLESADLCLAYDPSVYEYVDVDDSGAPNSAMVAAGLSALDTGLATCSLIFTDSCSDDDLDENGCLQLVTYSFKPLVEDYNIEDFCLWATSYSVNGKDVVKKVEVAGQANLKTGHTVVVTVSPTTASTSLFGDGTKWYVYLIAGVLAVSAIAGIAVIAIRNNKDSDNSNNSESADKKGKDSDKKD